MSSTIYTARFALPDLVERGKAQGLECPVYRLGALVVPEVGTVSIYDRSGTVQVLDASVIVTDGVASYTVPAATLEEEPYGDGWRVEWSLVIEGQTYTFRNDLALVKVRLYPPIFDRDLFERVSSLDPASSKPLTSLTNFQPYLDAAWRQIQLRLISLGRRPWLVTSPSALSEVHLTLTLALIFEDLASRLNDAFETRATSYRQQYADAWKMLTFSYDEDSDGTPGTAGTANNIRESAKVPIFLTRRD